MEINKRVNFEFIILNKLIDAGNGKEICPDKFESLTHDLAKDLLDWLETLE
ncbi:hypothetical protein KAR91_66870 [Candidatus Pacearchaeota archaeon]|nr:hypothetical protein [Candidatus Pacearchaeota archaeon]